jgi:hydrogenase-4 component F
MCIAAPFILVQSNLKRLLAYSSLEHIGLICVGIGLNSSLTIFGALLHMGYHALTKPVLFFAAGNIHQSCHTLQMRLIGPGMAQMLPLTVLCMSLAAVSATGLPPFGLFYSEMTVLNGGFAAGHHGVGIVLLVALLASFCGILAQLSRILLGVPRTARVSDASCGDGLPAMGLMLATLLLFSVWMPGALLDVMHRAAGIIGGEP